MNRRTFLKALAPLTTLFVGVKSDANINNKYKWKICEDHSNFMGSWYVIIDNNEFKDRICLHIGDYKPYNNWGAQVYYPSLGRTKRNHTAMGFKSMEEAKHWCEETYEKYFKNT